ncbi:MAG: sulfatase-like hydrolase/transferase [Phycisphaeraceae bacterium]
MALDRNLVVLLTSGMRSDVFSYLARWPVNTPHFDDLATWGISLPATTVSPAAGPARASLFTGLHPRQHGMLDEGTPAPSTTTWVHQLREAGYHIVSVGNVQPIADLCHRHCPVADVSTLANNDCAYLKQMADRGRLDAVQQQRRTRLETGPFDMQPNPIPAEEDVDTFIAEQAGLAIETMPTDRPWVLIVNFTGPGNDLPAPDRFSKHIDAAALHRGFAPADLAALDQYAEIPYPRTLIQNLNGERISRIRQHYLARVALLDHGLGRIRSALDKHDLGSTTWITHCSDRGQLLGERGLVGHRSLLGPAVTVPLWILPPETMNDLPIRKSGETLAAHRLVGTVDFVATLCAIAGVDPPRGCDGQSVLPAMHHSEVGRDHVLCEYSNRCMLETMQHRIIYDVDTQHPRALFDLLRDPDELNDLVGTTTAVGVLDMLQWQLASALLPLRPILPLNGRSPLPA